MDRLDSKLLEEEQTEEDWKILENLAWMDVATAVALRRYERIKSNFERLKAENEMLEEYIKILMELLKECEVQEKAVSTNCF